MITYVEQPGLLAHIAAQGHVVICENGVFISDDAAATQAIIDGYAGSAAELQWWQAAQAALVGAQYAARIAAGRSYTVPGDASGAHVYQIDEVPTPTRQSSQQAIAAVAAMADRALRVGTSGTPWDDAATPPFFFIDTANSHVAMTAQQAYDFATAIGSYCTALKLCAAQINAAIFGASTVAAVQAIDPAVGWPT